MAKVICAWCAAVLYDSPVERISHGICAACMEEQLAEVGKTTVEDKLDQLENEQ